MPIEQFNVDLSQAGKGLRIKLDDPATQQIVPVENEKKWVDYYLGHGSRILETIVITTAAGHETFHIMTKVGN